MQKEPYSMRRVLLNQPPQSSSDIGVEEEMSDEEEESAEDGSPESKSFVFLSPNFSTATRLVVLIHGSGVVRAGQWARRLLMNDTLASGSQLPYIAECLERDWAVLVMNTNDNHYSVQVEGVMRRRRKKVVGCISLSSCSH